MYYSKPDAICLLCSHRSRRRTILLLTAALFSEVACTPDPKGIRADLLHQRSLAGLTIGAVRTQQVLNVELVYVPLDSSDRPRMRTWDHLSLPSAQVSSDGTRIAGVADDSWKAVQSDYDPRQNRKRIVILDTDGRELWQWRWETPGQPGVPTLSPDYRTLALNTPQGIRLLDVAGRLLSPPLSGTAKLSHTPTGPVSWSPDSAVLLYEHDSKIMTYTIATAAIRTLAQGRDPLWSPDGRWISFRAADDTASLLPPQGGPVHTLRPGHPVVGSLRWSPDGAYLLVSEVKDSWRARLPALLLAPPQPERLLAHHVRDGVELLLIDGMPLNMTRDFCWMICLSRSAQ